MTAKFNSKCVETGKPLRKGDEIFYDRDAKKAYHSESEAVKKWLSEKESQDVSNYVDAMENARFDNWYSANY